MAYRFFIKTYGCQMNKNDSLIVGKILSDHGFEQAADMESADVLIVNTCSVREHAENRALAYVSGLRGWRKRSNRVLAVVGCLAKDRADKICKSLDFVDLILGPDSYRKVAEYVSQALRIETRIIDTDPSGETYCGIHPQTRTVSGFVSIMRGCSNYCSYCVVPYVRGHARSRPARDIFDEITFLTASGVKDITLLGQNVNEYQYEDFDFARLLARSARIPGIFRLRFLTSHPKDFSKRTIDVIKDSHSICEWFHLPLQSGNNRILKMMNRKYTKEQYIALVQYIREEIPHATITTDVIVGFPTETAEEFSETLTLLEEIRFDDAYMYRYSTRVGTEASGLESLDDDTIGGRLSRLIDVQHQIVKEKTGDMIGKEYEILFEGAARGCASRGKTRGNKDVVVQECIEPGAIRNVVINEVKGHTPIGELSDA